MRKRKQPVQILINKFTAWCASLASYACYAPFATAMLCERRSKTGSIQGKVKLYLGNKHSSKYKTNKQAISRRNELKWLEKRYKDLLALFEKAVSQLVGQGIYSEQSLAIGKQFDLHKDRSSTERDRPNQELKKSTQIREEFNLAIAAAEKLENA
ncbi:MAG: hypothetical protein ACFBSE_23510 [Prochloraceae cyanobacterium]